MKKTRSSMRILRKRRIRAVISGTAKRPRMSVFRSNTALSVQLVDDDKGVTILSARGGKTEEQAKLLGAEVARRAVKEHHIQAVVFDRGGYRYHGVIAALADAAREAGLTL